MRLTGNHSDSAFFPSMQHLKHPNSEGTSVFSPTPGDDLMPRPALTWAALAAVGWTSAAPGRAPGWYDNLEEHICGANINHEVNGGTRDRQRGG